ncbi:TonB-dependent receptor [Luteibacter aegosomatissinici]|uniref:TonB-dependent receptor n=1 Tax=Luteibacter aegosomatissinici TaxID=2911539 RepID=UPI001FF9F443|nr:TonB-dependent receptor [Luteibacter aegosomatissinici]UPG92731.1 TonB-dependent receptor [Luteibacter aegosomatissinici]
MHVQSFRRAGVNRPTALAFALAVCLGASAPVFAQATTGAIFGQVPFAANETILISGSTGFTREVSVDAQGRYRLGNIPLGAYNVSLKRDGAVVDSRKNVQITVGGSTDVSFDAPTAALTSAQSLDSVTVVANALPPIDTTAVDSRTVVTSETLARLPLGRNAEAIALLAPGAVPGSSNLGNGRFRTVSFGGSGASENAYYINGYNTTDPYKNLGGVGLPYGAIDQQEVYTGGYSAKYGRSDGGVISQVGKRGTNDWHFGAQILWEPKFAASNPGSIYYGNRPLPAGYGYQDPSKVGAIYKSGDDNTKWTTTYSAYVGGPLIKDKLFFFVAAEAEKSEGESTSSVEANPVATNHYTYKLPKYYAKLDWNINDSNILELTGIHSTDEQQGYYTGYDYDARSGSGRTGANADTSKIESKYAIAKYTSYITDDLTLSATYAKGWTDDYLHNPTPNLDQQPYIYNPYLQNPALNGGRPISNLNSSQTTQDPSAGSRTHGLRLDLEWQVGDHHLAGGIDNMHYRGIDEGTATSGPGYYWRYFRSANPGNAISSSQGVGAPGGDGYYARKVVFSSVTNMSLDQRAQYLEDRWQVTDRVLLSVGVRNDRFKNFNDENKPYVNQAAQWAPRLGASWDVFGDSSLKVYGNVGRYYLALPNNVAVRGASPSTYTFEYFSYTGIDSNGRPTGLKALGPGPVSPDGEYGQPVDAQAVAARDLKSQYQDEGIVGFDKTLGDGWVTGANLTVRKLRTAIDDVCDTGKIGDKLSAEGINPDSVVIPGCVIFNPGDSNTFSLANANGVGRTDVKMSMDDWGFTDKAKRNYYALDMYLEHPFDGKWQGRLDYTFSRSYGNTEGQTKSDIGQTDISKTQDWDSAELMRYANGLLSNDRTHQIKAYGSYQLTPEWLLSGNLRLASGAPKSCLGYEDGEADPDPIGYQSAYHNCNGQPSHPGAKRNPWYRQVDLAVAYRPAYFDSKLAFGVQVFNATNERKPLNSYSTYESVSKTVLNNYDLGEYYQTPRYARLTVSYDF